MAWGPRRSETILSQPGGSARGPASTEGLSADGFIAHSLVVDWQTEVRRTVGAAERAEFRRDAHAHHVVLAGVERPVNLHVLIFIGVELANKGHNHSSIQKSR